MGAYEELILKPYELNGVKHIPINGVWFSQIVKKPFVEWLEISTKVTFDEFMRTSRKDREIVFLRWKHGCSDDSNAQAEVEEMATLNMIRNSDFSKESAEYRFWAANKLRFHRFCQNTKEKIGLCEIKVDTKMANVMRRFGGRPVAVGV